MFENDFVYVIRTKPGDYQSAAEEYDKITDMRIAKMQRDTERYIDDLNARTTRQVSRAQSAADILRDFYAGKITQDEMTKRLADQGIK